MLPSCSGFGAILVAAAVSQRSRAVPCIAQRARHGLDRLRRLPQFLLDPVDLRERATKFLGKNRVPLQKVESLNSHPLEDRLQDVEVARKPLAGCSKQPDSVLAAPARFAVNLPKLVLIAGDQCSDRMERSPASRTILSMSLSAMTDLSLLSIRIFGSVGSPFGAR